MYQEDLEDHEDLEVELSREGAVMTPKFLKLYTGTLQKSENFLDFFFFLHKSFDFKNNFTLTKILSQDLSLKKFIVTIDSRICQCNDLRLKTP